MGGKHATQEERDGIVAAYLSGLSPEVAAEKFGYSHMVLYRELRLRGISLRWGDKGRKYAVDEAFFDVINSEAKAYWLGFLTADGSIRAGYRAVEVNLARRDRPHLEKFGVALKAEHPITDGRTRAAGKWYTRSSLNVVSAALAQALCRLGVHPNKSGREAPCTQVPDELMRHYWRGVFDGDGHIYQKTDSTSPRWEIGLVGSQAIVEGFRSFLAPHIKSTARNRKMGSIRRVTYTGVRLPQKILSALYEGATIYLERKKDLVDQILALPNQVRDWSELTGDDLADLYFDLGSWQDVAARLGTSPSNISRLKKTLGLGA